METVVSSREIQRSYRRLIDEVKRKKHPLFLGPRLKPEAVLIDIDSFHNLQGTDPYRQKSWQAVKERLKWIGVGGGQGITLSKFIHENRRSH